MKENTRLLERLESNKGVMACTKDLLTEHRRRQMYAINASNTKRLSGDYNKELAQMRRANSARKERARRVLQEVEEKREEKRRQEE
eukprot:CAMPEP_0179167298 /NCGR_PEP_ID=MMETSP0796-20121207/82245_1 /TAXON_ID=73915 /ORGANISM="Pyrodinium bahamense, Strain pbaha01" /LENGTH=85 /DNA_ID=CAMNT_0020869979 /DNA_START=15 /DNA_END=269 /DNA_ORIENTATION=-